MFLEEDRMVHWKTWAATHDCEELKGVRPEVVQAMRTDKHRKVTRKLVVERGWVRKRVVRHWLFR